MERLAASFCYPKGCHRGIWSDFLFFIFDIIYGRIMQLAEYSLIFCFEE